MMLNKGASFLVSPANMSYETQAAKVAGANHSKVMQGLERMMKLHEDEELKKMKGLSEEMIAKRKSKKSPQMQTIEKMMTKVKENVAGQRLNGREMKKPDVKIATKLQRFVAQSPSPTHAMDKNGSQSLFLDENKEREVRDFT